MNNNLSNDSYGRTVSVVTNDSISTYTIFDPISSATFTLQYPSTTQIGQVYSSINALAPSWYAAPVSTSIANNSQVTSPGAYPYVMLNSDEIISVDTSQPRTIYLPDATQLTPPNIVYINDVIGMALLNNIIIKTQANQRINGTSLIKIQVNFSSVKLYIQNGNWFSF